MTESVTTHQDSKEDFRFENNKDDEDNKGGDEDYEFQSYYQLMDAFIENSAESQLVLKKLDELFDNIETECKGEKETKLAIHNKIAGILATVMFRFGWFGLYKSATPYTPHQTLVSDDFKNAIEFRRLVSPKEKYNRYWFKLTIQQMLYHAHTSQLHNVKECALVVTKLLV